MPDGTTVEPADFHCPTLWLVGSEDPHAMASVDEYRGCLERSKVTTHILDGPDHEGVFDKIGRVFPIMAAFTQK